MLTIAQLAKKHGIHPKKQFGQNFILDASLCDKIVRFSGLQPGEGALEVGPGIGGLTRSILEAKPEFLLAIEKDDRCCALLDEIKSYYPSLILLSQDALDFKFVPGQLKLTIISNLPYYVGTQLLFHFLRNLIAIKSITVMLQKEVVDRIIAKPNSKNYGRLSIICQLLCDVEKGFDVGPKAFYPPPKVTSAVVKLTPKAEPLDLSITETIENLTRVIFNSRRKMLSSTLKNISPDYTTLLDQLNIDGNLRPENLTPQAYLELAKILLSQNTVF